MRIFFTHLQGIIPYMLALGVGMAATHTFGISPDMVNNARRIYNLEIEAYTRRGVHPAYALAAILRDEGGEDNAQLAAAILETGIGFGGINPAYAANPLETAIARLTAFSLGANYSEHLFNRRATGIAARHQSELRAFFERGKNVFPNQDPDLESSDFEFVTTQSFAAALPPEDRLRASAALVVQNFALGISPLHYIEELLTPYFHLSKLSVSERTNGYWLRKWVKGQVWDKEYVPNVLQASLLVLEDPENHGELTAKALSNIRLGLGYALRAEFAAKFPLVFTRLTNRIIEEETDIESLEKIYQLAEKYFSQDYWNRIILAKGQIEIDQFFAQLQVSIGQGIKALFTLRKNSISNSAERLINISTQAKELLKSAAQNSELTSFEVKAYLKLAKTLESTLNAQKKKYPQYRIDRFLVQINDIIEDLEKKNLHSKNQFHR
jgi:hypothetical protein